MLQSVFQSIQWNVSVINKVCFIVYNNIFIYPVEDFCNIGIFNEKVSFNDVWVFNLEVSFNDILFFQ